MPKRLRQSDFLWVGGVTCLDFSNTKSFRPTADPLDRFDTFEHLLDWAELAGLISGRRRREIERESKKQARRARETLVRAKTLREMIYRFCTKKRPNAGDIDEFNRAAAATLSHRHLVWSRGRFHWQWMNGSDDLACVLWPVVQSAIELYTSVEMDFVRECALETCSAVFLDSSKNKSRRWCDMKDCGNLAKARAHYARKRL